MGVVFLFRVFKIKRLPGHSEYAPHIHIHLLSLCASGIEHTLTPQSHSWPHEGQSNWDVWSSPRRSPYGINRIGRRKHGAAVLIRTENRSKATGFGSVINNGRRKKSRKPDKWRREREMCRGFCMGMNHLMRSPAIVALLADAAAVLYCLLLMRLLLSDGCGLRKSERWCCVCRGQGWTTYNIGSLVFRSSTARGAKMMLMHTFISNKSL